MDNVEKARPPITIDIFGGPHTLEPNFLAFWHFENVTGKNAMLASTWASASATDMATFLWAALGGDELGKTAKEVARAMSGVHLAKVQDLIAEIFKRAEVPEKKDDAA